MSNRPTAPPPAVRVHRRALWVAAMVTVSLVGLAQFPADDGLRHVGVAHAQRTSWGKVYPLSIFAQHAGYDPWLGHDLALRALARLLEPLPLSRLARQFIVVKLTSTLFMALLIGLALQRAQLEPSNPGQLFVALLIIAAIFAHPLTRFGLVRPFAFGTFYLLYGLRREGFIRGALATGGIWFFYPYLAWIYAGPAFVSHIWRGSRRYALGVAAASVAALAIQPVDFWQLVWQIFRSDGYRAQIELKITEFASPLAHLPYVGFFFVAWLMLLPGLRPEERRLDQTKILLLLFAIPSLKYIRYVLDVMLPLFFVAYGQALLRSLEPPLRRFCSWLAARLSRRASSGEPAEAALQAGPSAEPPGEAADSSAAPSPDEAAAGGSWVVRSAIVVLYLVTLVMIGWIGRRDHLRAVALQRQLAAIPRSALVVCEFNVQYQLLYARPDLRLIPSSEISFAAPQIRREYLRLFNDGDPCPLLARSGARFFVERGGMYLDPRSHRCLKLVSERKEWKLWRRR